MILWTKNCQHIWTIEDHDSNFGVPVVESQTEKWHQFIFLVWLSLDSVFFDFNAAKRCTHIFRWNIGAFDSFCFWATNPVSHPCRLKSIKDLHIETPLKTHHLQMYPTTVNLSMALLFGEAISGHWKLNSLHFLKLTVRPLKIGLGKESHLPTNNFPVRKC